MAASKVLVAGTRINGEYAAKVHPDAKSKVSGSLARLVEQAQRSTQTGRLITKS